MNRWTSRIAIVMCVCSAVAQPALAQEPARIPEAEGSVVTWVVAIALVLLVCITAFINPKRSHHAK